MSSFLSGFALSFRFSLPLLAFFLYSTALQAKIEPEPNIRQLAQSFTWKKLIQAGKNNEGGDLATVLSDGFYLSGSETLNPQAELDATLQAFSSNQILNNTPAACQFPARYLWLSTQLPQLASTWFKPNCIELDKWSDLNDLDGISLIQVSGYFGNPASAFGHLLLQVNRKGGNGVRGLQDIGVNFGASVPDGEGTLAYVFKGLFGAYNASFSDQSFYAQDYVYSATEFRDMWAYELNLTPFQQKMILYHLWELKDALFKYYFLKINCAFHLAQLMEIAFETDFGLDHQPWYLPVSVFHQLSDMDAKQPGSIIKSIQFVPSVQREVHLAFEQLSEEEKILANRYVLSREPHQLPDSASSALLDFLLLYVDYKIQSQSAQMKEPWRKRRTPVLLARLQLPVSQVSNTIADVSVERFAPPAAGPRSRKIGFGFNIEKSAIAGQSLVFAPFAYDVLNRNTGSLIDSTFKLGETTLVFNKGVTRLKKLDIISIEKLALPVTQLAGEQKWTWRMAMGVQHFLRRCDSCLSPFVAGGIGRNKGFGNKINVYGYLTAELNRLGVDAGLAIGAMWDVWPGARLRLESSSELLSDKAGIANTSLTSYTLSSLFNLGRGWDLSISANGPDTNKMAGTVLVQHRW